jgi:hypothetical protein
MLTIVNKALQAPDDIYKVLAFANDIEHDSNRLQKHGYTSNGIVENDQNGIVKDFEKRDAPKKSTKDTMMKSIEENSINAMENTPTESMKAAPVQAARHYLLEAFIPSNSALESLILEIHPNSEEECSYNKYFSHVFERAILPNLREFRYGGQSVTLVGLTSFLYRHASTLKSLELSLLGLLVHNDDLILPDNLPIWLKRGQNGGPYHHEGTHGYWVYLFDFISQYMELENVRFGKLLNLQRLEDEAMLFEDEDLIIDDGDVKQDLFKVARRLEGVKDTCPCLDDVREDIFV